MALLLALALVSLLRPSSAAAAASQRLVLSSSNLTLTLTTSPALLRTELLQRRTISRIIRPTRLMPTPTLPVHLQLAWLHLCRLLGALASRWPCADQNRWCPTDTWLPCWPAQASTNRAAVMTATELR